MKNRILVIVLIFATIVNIVIHLASPAYSKYLYAVKRLDDQFLAFKNQIARDFIPAISNGFYLAKGRVVSSSSTNCPTSSLEQFEKSSRAPDPKKVTGRVGSYAGRYFVRIDEWDLFVGDRFDGSVIRDISKQSITTDLCVYRVVPEVDKPVAHEVKNESVVVNAGNDVYKGGSLDF